MRLDGGRYDLAAAKDASRGTSRVPDGTIRSPRIAARCPAASRSSGGRSTSRTLLADPEYTLSIGAATPGYRTMLGVPLLRDGVAIGVIVLTRASVRPFTDEQIELVYHLRGPGGDRHRERAAVRELQARTRELTESLEQQTATAEVLQVISSSPFELRPVFRPCSRTRCVSVAPSLAPCSARGGCFSRCCDP